MGLGMATNLQRHLSRLGAPALHHHNRTMSRGQALQGLGSVPCESIADLVSNSDLIFLSLSDDSALAATIDAVVGGASPVAAEGRLLFVLAGPDDAVRAISPFLVGVMGRGVIRLGEDAKEASLLKTAG